MKKLTSVFLLSLSIILVWGIGTYINHDILAQDDESSYRLDPKDVLMILARPLPEGSTKGYYLPNANMSNLNLIGVDFKSANLSYSDLSHSLFVNADFSSASMQEVDLSNANFSTANFSNTWLFASNLENAIIRHATLNGANLEDANLRNTNFTSSSLINVNLTGANLTGTSFTLALMQGVTLPNGKKYQEGDDLVAEFGAKSNP